MKADAIGVLECSRGPGRRNGWAFPSPVNTFLRERYAGSRVLHLFGGMAKWGTRLDLDPGVRPDVIGDAWLPPFGVGSFDVVILDPPYVRMNVQEEYALLSTAGAIAKVEVCWFHTLWLADKAGMRCREGYTVVIRNCLMRALQFFRPVREISFPKHFRRGTAMRYNKWMAGQQSLEFGVRHGATREA